MCGWDKFTYEKLREFRVERPTDDGAYFKSTSLAFPVFLQAGCVASMAHSGKIRGMESGWGLTFVNAMSQNFANYNI